MSKLENLRKILKDLGSVVVAYSGGLDSTFLLKVALDVLGKDNVLAVTARSETYPVSEFNEARALAKKLGSRHLVINTCELNIKGFRDNPVNRCYYCKKELFKKLISIKNRYKLSAVLDGTNYDDLKDIRHGRKAAKELGIKSPLLDAKIGKSDIRKHSKRLKLSTWDKPSFACLASRFPFHDTINAKDLTRIDEAELYLRKLGFKQVRLRLHKDIARLEIYKTDFDRVLDQKNREDLIKKLKRLGFKYITLDLEGYRTGSMHEAVD